MKRIVCLLCCVFLVCGCLFADTKSSAQNQAEEDYNKLINLIAQADSLSGVVLINSNSTIKPASDYTDYKVVVIGPDCHVLPGWSFYRGSIDVLVVYSTDLKSRDSYSVIYNETIGSSYTNSPYVLVEKAIKEALGID